MKKTIICAVPAILLMSACSAEQPVSAAVPDIAFSAQAEISYCGTDLSADVIRSGTGCWELRVTSPYALEGLVMTTDGSGTTLKMFGSESSADVSGDAVSAVRALAAVYESAVGVSDIRAGSDGGYTLSGTSELGAYTAELDSGSVPVMFSADCGNLSVKLSGFTELPPAEREAEIVM